MELVISYKGRAFAILLPDYDRHTLSDLKQIVEARTGIKIENQNLIYSGGKIIQLWL